jgi:hypothetical protein
MRVTEWGMRVTAWGMRLTALEHALGGIDWRAAASSLLNLPELRTKSRTKSKLWSLKSKADL